MSTLDEVLTLDEVAVPSAPAANQIILFARDVGGVTRFYSIDSAGTVQEVGAGVGGRDLLLMGA